MPAETNVIERSMVLMETDGTCVIGLDEHQHPNVADCFERGHTLRRIDTNTFSPDNWTARFQHGDNPEHSLVLNLLASPSEPCTGFAVDAWVAAIHRAAPPETPKGGE